MSIVQQVLCCPVCGSSGKPARCNLAPDGSLVPEEDRVLRLPVLKIQYNEGNCNIRWESHDLPANALRNLIDHMENTLAAAKEQLAKLEAEG